MPNRHSESILFIFFFLAIQWDDNTADDCHERNSPMDPNRLLIIARKACYGACGWMGSFTRATNSRTHDQKHGNATFSANVLKSDEQAVKTWFSAF